MRKILFWEIILVVLITAITRMIVLHPDNEKAQLSLDENKVTTEDSSSTIESLRKEVIMLHKYKPKVVHTSRVLSEKTISRGSIEKSFRITNDQLSTLTMLDMISTAYTLSPESCGKSRSHKQYGITFTGTRATIKRTVAVDPKVIPLKSVLYIDFSETYNEMDGIYVAEDTGRLVKNNIIDIFIGEDSVGENTIEVKALKFGRQPVKVYIVERGN